MKAFVDFILGTVAFVGVMFLIQLFFAFIAKAGNVNIVSKSGTKIATPKDFDANIEAIKNSKNDIKELLAKAIKKISREDSTKSISEKIKLLKDLDDLKNKNVLTDTEFNELRSKII